MGYTWDYSDPYEYMARAARQDFPPLIISVAITGGGGGKEVNPNLPETPEEQAQQTYEAYRAGASIVHIHARDETGANVSYDPPRYREVNRRIRELCPDLIIGNSTGTGPQVTLDDAARLLEADPEICSLDMGAFSIRMTLKARKPPLRGRPEDQVLEWIFPFTATFHETIAKECLARNIKPELEIFSAPMFEAVQNLIRQDLLQKPYWFQFVFSPIQSGLATPKHLIAMIDALPADSLFSVIGVGPYQLPLTTMAIITGGHVRVGFEDNVYYRKGELARSNAQFVERVVRIAKDLGREIATPAQARDMLGISQTPKRY